MSIFYRIMNGEQLSPEQTQRRAALVTALLDYYTKNLCCRRRPDWAEKIHRMRLEQLEARYFEVFNRELP